MKRNVYIFLFVVVGFLLQLLIHALVEHWYIGLLVRDISVYGFGLGWDAWFVIHKIFTAVMLMLGLVFGWRQGVYWWPRLYDENGVRKKLKK